MTGITKSDSEKKDKRLANRKNRRKNRQREEPLDIRETSNIWNWNKDGKSYWGEDMPDELWRK